MIKDILVYNESFVRENPDTSTVYQKMPKKKLAILACMDVRLTELLPKALGIKDGDATIIKNAGAMILDDFDSSVRSLLLSVLMFGAEEIMVIAHTDCGVESISPQKITNKLEKCRIEPKTIESLKKKGLDFEQWFSCFSSPERSVQSSVALLKNHPFMPKDICICGFVMDITTGRLTPV